MTTPARPETVLTVKIYDLLAWLTPCVEKFPRAQRFLLASRILNTAFACHEELVRARKVTGADRERALVAADTDLEALRVQWRLAHELRYISIGQYQHGAKRMDEVGRLLGSWRKG